MGLTTSITRSSTNSIQGLAASQIETRLFSFHLSSISPREARKTTMSLAALPLNQYACGRDQCGFGCSRRTSHWRLRLVGLASGRDLHHQQRRLERGHWSGFHRLGKGIIARPVMGEGQQ